MEAEIITALFHNGLAAVTFQDMTMGKITAVMSANQAIEPEEIIAFSGRQIRAHTHTAVRQKKKRFFHHTSTVTRQPTQAADIGGSLLHDYRRNQLPNDFVSAVMISASIPWYGVREPSSDSTQMKSPQRNPALPSFLHTSACAKIGHKILLTLHSNIVTTGCFGSYLEQLIRGKQCQNSDQKKHTHTQQ